MKNLELPQVTVSFLVVSLLLVIAALLVQTPAAAVTVRYTYVGTVLTPWVHSEPFPANPVLGDHITMSFTYTGDLSSVVGFDNDLVEDPNLTEFVMRCGDLELSTFRAGMGGTLYINGLVGGLPLGWQAGIQSNDHTPVEPPFWALWSNEWYVSGLYTCDDGVRYVRGEGLPTSELNNSDAGLWSAEVVPLPPTALLLGSSLIPLAWFRRKRRLGR